MYRDGCYSIDTTQSVFGKIVVRLYCASYIVCVNVLLDARADEHIKLAKPLSVALSIVNQCVRDNNRPYVLHSSHSQRQQITDRLSASFRRIARASYTHEGALASIPAHTIWETEYERCTISPITNVPLDMDWVAYIVVNSTSEDALRHGMRNVRSLQTWTEKDSALSHARSVRFL